MRTRWVKVLIKDTGPEVECPPDMPENEAHAILRTGMKMMSDTMQEMVL